MNTRFNCVYVYKKLNFFVVIFSTAKNYCELNRHYSYTEDMIVHCENLPSSTENRSHCRTPCIHIS